MWTTESDSVRSTQISIVVHLGLGDDSRLLTPTRPERTEKSSVLIWQCQWHYKIIDGLRVQILHESQSQKQNNSLIDNLIDNSDP